MSRIEMPGSAEYPVIPPEATAFWAEACSQWEIFQKTAENTKDSELLSVIGMGDRSFANPTQAAETARGAISLINNPDLLNTMTAAFGGGGIFPLIAGIALKNKSEADEFDSNMDQCRVVDEVCKIALRGEENSESRIYASGLQKRAIKYLSILQQQKDEQEEAKQLESFRTTF